MLSLLCRRAPSHSDTASHLCCYTTPTASLHPERRREEGKKEATGSYDKKEVTGERKERDKGRGKKKRKMKEKDKKEKLENIDYKKEVYYIFLRNCES
jgi:hypothetical protein